MEKEIFSENSDELTFKIQAFGIEAQKVIMLWMIKLAIY